MKNQTIARGFPLTLTRIVCVSFVLFEASFCLAQETQGVKKNSQRPNILFILTDQQRGDAVGCDGNPILQTPHLDRLAREGAMFSRAYSSVPSCKPARTTLLTSLNPWNHGSIGYAGPAEEYPREIVKMLRDEGYYCMGIGKMHFTPQQNLHGYHKILFDESGRDGQDGGPKSRGFVSDYRKWFKEVAPGLNPDATIVGWSDGWNDHRQRYYALPTHLHPTAWTGDRAVEFVEEWDGEQPFFLKVSFARPHSPYDAPKEYCEFYEQNRDRMPGRIVGDWAEQNARRGEKFPGNLWRGDLGPKAPIDAKIGYYGSISFIDEQVGRILEALEKKGQLDNTFILMTSDHGDMMGDHHLWRKSYAYEGSARIPMLIRWGKTIPTSAPTNQRLPQLVELRDVGVTFLSVAGVPYDPEWFDGQNMMSLVLDNQAPWRQILDLEHANCYARENHWSALTNGKMKYIFNAYSGAEQLFDLEKDPQELHDLSSDPAHAAELQEWRERLIEHLAPRGEGFVKDGQLVYPRTPSQIGRNFPSPK
ncbi:MAG: arylsulfatase [Planctomycetia bacterium]|nr:arylsulfatase [Planctomycetia bacterium]